MRQGNNSPQHHIIAFTGNESMALYKFRLSAMLKLKNRGFKIVAIAPKDSYSNKIQAEGIEFIPIKMKANQISIIDDLHFFWQLLKLYIRLQPSLIFNYTVKANIYGNIAAFIAGKIPTISVIPGRGFTFHKKNWLYYIVRSLYQLALFPSIEVWFLNEEDEQFFIQEGMVSKEKTKVLPGEGVNTNYFLPALPKNKVNSNTTFLLSGRLLWKKGVGEFVQAAKIVLRKYPQCQFHLLGFLDDKDQRVVPIAKVQEWVAEGTVNFMGVADDVRPYFHQSDCFVLPSYYGEGLPRTILEAASMSIPVITTDHRGCNRAVIHGKTGYLCKKKDAEDLANKMIEFINLSFKDKLLMGKNGRNLVKENFEESILTKIYASKVLSLLKIPSQTESANKMVKKEITS